MLSDLVCSADFSKDESHVAHAIVKSIFGGNVVWSGDVRQKTLFNTVHNILTVWAKIVFNSNAER